MTDIRPAAHHIAIICSIPSIKDIIRDIKMLKKEKYPGPSLTPANALEADPQTTARILQALLTKIWETEELPPDWHYMLLSVRS